MPTTFQMLAVLTVAVMPGALFHWGYEREVGGWGLGLQDRVLRFVGASVVLHVLIAPLTLSLLGATQPDRLTSDEVSLWLWPLGMAYIAVPFSVGLLAGWGVKNRTQNKLTKALATVSGTNVAPDAWSQLFVSAPEGWVRVRTKDGRWLGGLFYLDKQTDRKAYASGPSAKYPDLLLYPGVDLDNEGGFPDVTAGDLDFTRTIWLSRDSISSMDFYYF